MTTQDGAAQSYRAVVRTLAGAQKPALPGSPPYSVYVNRRAGRLIAAWAYRAGLSPNAVTGISAVLTFSGILVIALVPTAPWVGLVVWLLLALGYAFDSADGQVARLAGGGSPAGEWLDHVVDSAKISALHLAVAVAMFRFFGFSSAAWLLIPVLYVVVANVTFFGMILNDLLRAARGGSSDRTPGSRSALKTLLLVPTDYGVLCLVFLLLGWPALFTIVYGLFFVANLGALGIALPRWFRQMRELGRKSDVR
ncbi:CDP-alcohol phosphatidyltransferase family protein [Leifsonia sp. NPDC077715]|uniref:CDP-alcohol phosphatidyltransferase family protein n=1 Tax=Leifsonia sp. NPDC077715 TaxID=3155539 RepID=UPI00342EC7AB